MPRHLPEVRLTLDGAEYRVSGDVVVLPGGEALELRLVGAHPDLGRPMDMVLILSDGRKQLADVQAMRAYPGVLRLELVGPVVLC